MYEHADVFIDGAWQPTTGTTTLEVINPSTEETFGTIGVSSADDVDRAVRSADRALRSGPWPKMSFEERCAIVLRIKDAIAARTEELATITTSTLGQLYRQAIGLGSTPEVIDMYLQTLQSMNLEFLRTDELGTSLVTRKPVGVVAAITPWNTPLRAEVKKAIPAILTGSTVVLKSSPETPFAGAIFAEIAAEAGLPDGVLNVVFGGAETGTALVQHPLVRKVAFTGSTATGSLIGEHCGRTFKRMQLELGGKSAAIILDDADLGAVLPWIDLGNFNLTGQMCVALSRVITPRSRYDETVEALADSANKHVLGDPFDAKVTMGPLVAERQRTRVLNYMEIARSEGAEIVAGGGRAPGFDRGWFVEPTVVRNVDNTMRIAREEVFGPVVCVIPYDTEEEAISIANDSPYGLHGAVFGTDQARALAVARELDTGSVAVNRYGLYPTAPFGGVKNSGVNREHGPESFDSYLEYVPYSLPPELAETLSPTMPRG